MARTVVFSDAGDVAVDVIATDPDNDEDGMVFYGLNCRDCVWTEWADGTHHTADRDLVMQRAEMHADSPHR